MADKLDGPDIQVGLHWGRLAARGMRVIAAMLAIVATIWAVAAFATLGQAQLPGPAAFASGTSIILGLVGAWAIALLLWGAAEVLHRLIEFHESGRAAASAPPPPMPMPRPRPVNPVTDGAGSPMEQLIEAVQDLRDVSLLNEDERMQRAQAESEALVRQLEAEVPILLREHSWQEARTRVERARVRFPSAPQWAVLAEQVELARARFESHDVERAAREINDLASLGAWDRAATVIQDLQRRHPGSPQVAELAQRVHTGRERATAEERARLMARAQEATNKRDWEEALRWVEQVMTRFPKSAEAHDLRLQLPTLQANVEIHRRQQMENQIRDLVKIHRYADAVRISREVLDQYPDSPQAAALREQLPRLEEKARRG